MASLAKFNSTQNPLPFSLSHKTPCFSTPISSISFKPHFSPSSISFKIKSSSSNSEPISFNSPKKSNPKTLNSIPSLLKTPLTIAVAATAIFFTGLSNTLNARAEVSPPPPMAETSTRDYDQSEGQKEDNVSDEERERELEEAVGSNPDNVEALKSLAEVKVKRGKLAEAVEIIKRLIKVEPKAPEWPLVKCFMHSYLGEFEIAKAGFEEILAKDPLRAEAFHGLITLLPHGEAGANVQELSDLTRRIQEAIARSVKENKAEGVRDLKLLIAHIRVIEENYEEAFKMYEELVKEEPRDFRPYLFQGVLYTLLKKEDEAEKQFDKYRKLVPKGPPYDQFFDDKMTVNDVLSQMDEMGV